MYNEVLVVEGKNDKSRILAIFPNLQVITTNGSEVSKETLEMIKELSLTHKIILFLDPDKPGERIRSLITNVVPNADQAFIEKNKAIDERKHKVGVEHATNEDIIAALENRLSPADTYGTLVMSDLYDLGLCGQPDSTTKREFLCKKLNLGVPNAKTFLKRINLINLSKEEMEAILNETNWNN